MLVPAILEQIAQDLSSRLSKKVNILEQEPLAGGCINQVYKIVTDKGIFCVKYNPNPPSDFFVCEEEGLKALGQTQLLKVPKVIVSAKKQYLVLEYLFPSTPSSAIWYELGQNLGLLHKNYTSTSFGYERDNYIGSVPQINTPVCSDWPTFFITRRIEPLLRLTTGIWESQHFARFEKLFSKLENYFPPTLPSLLHGDLWSGNVYFTLSNEAYLLDPAVYYGHPEAEIAFTHLFGGFDKNFYAGYYNVAAQETGFLQRIALYNLYPLLVHLYLFGGGYFVEVVNILKRFT